MNGSEFVRSFQNYHAYYMQCILCIYNALWFIVRKFVKNVSDLWLKEHCFIWSKSICQLFHSVSPLITILYSLLENPFKASLQSILTKHPYKAFFQSIFSKHPLFLEFFLNKFFQYLINLFVGKHFFSKKFFEISLENCIITIFGEVQASSLKSVQFVPPSHLVRCLKVSKFCSGVLYKHALIGERQLPFSEAFNSFHRIVLLRIILINWTWNGGKLWYLKKLFMCFCRSHVYAHTVQCTHKPEYVARTTIKALSLFTNHLVCG